MYTSFFGLSEKPFAITPDPRYLYLSERHAEALAHLLYGINESGGFIQLTGEVGTGKTTVVRTLLSRVPHHADVAVILNPRVSPVEFLQTICEELGIEIAPADRDSVKQMVDALNRRLLNAHAEGRRIIVLVDEAQNLSIEVLEQVRLLTNLETATQKLLQIILIGQPELRELLDRNDLRQLAQRITGRYHLKPLSREETKGYVRHRLKVAGSPEEIFTNGALEEVHRLSGGIPRIINVACDRALLGAYTQETRKITASLVRRAAGEVYGRRFLPTWAAWMVGSACVLALLFCAALAWQVYRKQTAVLQAAAKPVAKTLAAATANPPAPPPAAHPKPATVPLAEVLAANAPNTTDSAAYRRLLALWGTAMAEDKDPCGQASKAGLSCLEQRGSWAQVRALNRPAILELTDEKGEKYHVVLSQLDGGIATLNLGDQSARVSVEDLSKDWFGEFTVVWKPKTLHTRLLSLGMQGDEVRWLRRSLNALRGGASDPEHGDVYDEQLAIEVQNFQREHRLNVDGVAGIQTQVVLDTALAEPGSPLLAANTRGS
ncbi:MAG TPA: AAA family ATPase [Steroidobacteraceae bacterium]|jgi:general secretion pathway protein A